MDTLTISLPTPLKEFVEAQVAAGSYPTASAYITALVEQQQRRVREQVEALLREGLQTEAKETTKADWEEIRREGLERLAARKTP